MKNYMPQSSFSYLRPVEETILSECDEEPLMAEESSRSIFRETDDAMPYPPSVTRANPISGSVEFDVTAGGDRADSEYVGQNFVSVEQELSSSRFSSRAAPATRDDVDDDDMLDFDWTENADYEPAEDMNPILHHNASNAEFREPTPAQHIDYSAFFNAGSPAAVVNMEGSSPSADNVQAQQSSLNDQSARPSSSQSWHRCDESTHAQLHFQAWERISRESTQDRHTSYLSTRGSSSIVSVDSQSEVPLSRSTSSSSSAGSVTDFELAEMKHFQR